MWGVDGEGQGKRGGGGGGGSPSWRSININPLTSCEACACAGGIGMTKGHILAGKVLTLDRV